MPLGISVKRSVGSPAGAAAGRAKLGHEMALPLDRLRGQSVALPFHVVLVEPEIPPNTGNIARLAAATSSALHLVGRLGFSIDEHAVRRAGLDYWHLVDVRLHPDLDAAERAIAAESPGSRSWYFSGKAQRSYLAADFRLGDALVFGKESVGLPDALLEARADRVVGIPMPGLVRSLNLSNAVSIGLYEALRQTDMLAIE